MPSIKAAATYQQCRQAFITRHFTCWSTLNNDWGRQGKPSSLSNLKLKIRNASVCKQGRMLWRMTGVKPKARPRQAGSLSYSKGGRSGLPSITKGTFLLPVPTWVSGWKSLLVRKWRSRLEAALWSVLLAWKEERCFAWCWRCILVLMCMVQDTGEGYLQRWCQYQEVSMMNWMNWVNAFMICTCHLHVLS